MPLCWGAAAWLQLPAALHHACLLCSLPWVRRHGADGVINSVSYQGCTSSPHQERPRSWHCVRVPQIAWTLAAGMLPEHTRLGGQLNQTAHSPRTRGLTAQTCCLVWQGEAPQSARNGTQSPCVPPCILQSQTCCLAGSELRGHNQISGQFCLDGHWQVHLTVWQLSVLQCSSSSQAAC